MYCATLTTMTKAGAARRGRRGSILYNMRKQVEILRLLCFSRLLARLREAAQLRNVCTYIVLPSAMLASSLLL